MIKLTYDCRPSIGQRKNDMKTIKWTRWSSVSRCGVFFYTGAFARRLERERDRLKEVLQDLVEYLDLTHLPKQDSSLGIKCDRARKTISPSTKAGD